MRKAYVGIVSRSGLESLFPEEQHTTAFLLRRAARCRGQGNACFWAVMAPEIAAQIHHELALDNRFEALLLLQSLAYELGGVLPESVERVTTIVE